MQLNIKDSLSKVKIYGRYLSEFLLSDQVDILAKSLQKDIEQKLTLTDVSQQRELLIAWEKRGYSLEEWKIVEELSIEFIDDWLSNL